MASVSEDWSQDTDIDRLKLWCHKATKSLRSFM